MKYALVTGAYGGMGRAVTELLAENGYCVFALDVKNGSARENIIPVRADITSEDSVKEAFDEVSAQTDRLDAVLHFAGIYMLDSFAEMSCGDFKRIVDVNLTGAFLVNKVFFTAFKKRQPHTYYYQRACTFRSASFYGSVRCDEKRP